MKMTTVGYSAWTTGWVDWSRVDRSDEVTTGYRPISFFGSV